MDFVSIVVKAIKHKYECHILNLLLLFQLKIISYKVLFQYFDINANFVDLES